jgi:para-aminobenzoate synthetase component 1
VTNDPEARSRSSPAGSPGPLAAAARLAGCRCRVVLHSGRDDDDLGDTTFVTADPTATIEAYGRHIVRRDAAGRVARAWDGDPLDAVEAFAREHGAGIGKPPPRHPTPTVIGFFGYDLGRAIEALPRAGTRDTPDLWLGAYPAVARWFGDEHDVVGSSDAARALTDAIATPPRTNAAAPIIGELVADDDGDAHRARVSRILEYIAAGDVYQVNLARRLVAPIERDGDHLAIYRALDAVAPAPYGALIEADGVTVVSGSPECFLATRADGRIETRPIKGTRRRTGDPARDAALAAELASATKDGAEHLMIVDLERNDLGRVAIDGSVAVDRLNYIVELPHLYHAVSRVSAALRPDVGIAALLRATFPGGSITGAPKVRAMQIIDELEPAWRGPYCGAIGYFGADTVELSIAIRIATIVARELRIHVGGGIVADSDPSAELAETDDKAAGWRAALATLR